MKKGIIWLLVGLICATLGAVACGKPAPTPVITSETTSITNVVVGDEVVIPAVTATDEKDGDITANVTVKVVTTGKTIAIEDGKFIPTESGSYTIVYTVKNSSDKTATFEIPVTVDEKLIIGYDGRMSTSGLTDEIIANFAVDLNAYLDTTEYANVNPVIRKYDAETTSAIGDMIRADGDCDILIGFGSNVNLESGANIPVVHMQQTAMAGKTRYVCQLNDRAISGLVFTWLDEDNAEDSLALPTVVIGYNTAISGLTEEIIGNFEGAIENADFDYIVVVEGYATAEEGANADILIGFDGLTSKENVEIDVVETATDLDRNGDKTSVLAVFAWLQTEAALASLATPVPPAPQAYSLVIGWWSYYATNPGDKSGLTEANVNSYVAALETYLKANGYENLTITVVAFDNSTAKAMGDSIRAYNEQNADAPVDYVLGAGSNFNLSSGANITTASMKGVYKINGVSNRYFCSIKKLDVSSQLVNDAMAWTITDAGLATLGTVTKTA